MLFDKRPTKYVLIAGSRSFEDYSVAKKYIDMCLKNIRKKYKLRLSINLNCFSAAFTPHFVFPLTRAAEKHLTSEKTLIKRFFKGTGVVLAGMERSPKIFDF